MASRLSGKTPTIAGGRNRTAAARVLVEAINSQNSPVQQYTPGMRLSDHPGILNANEVAHALSDSEEDILGDGYSNQEYFSPQLNPVADSVSNDTGCSSLLSNSCTPTESQLFVTPRRLSCQVPNQDAVHQNSETMVVLFQKQQALLQRVLASQQAMTKKQEDIEVKLHTLKEDVKKKRVI